MSFVDPLTPRLPPRPDVADAGKEEIIQDKDFKVENKLATHYNCI